MDANASEQLLGRQFALHRLAGSGVSTVADLLAEAPWVSQVQGSSPSPQSSQVILPVLLCRPQLPTPLFVEMKGRVLESLLNFSAGLGLSLLSMNSKWEAECFP